MSPCTSPGPAACSPGVILDDRPPSDDSSPVATQHSLDNEQAWPFAKGEMANLVRTHDWAATPLGPLAQWPASLCTAVHIVLAHPFPTIVLWGRELIQVYNDPYRELMGVKHPAGLGQPTRECWPEVWHINGPIYERVWKGDSVSMEDALFPIQRSGMLEDAWFTISYSPVYDQAGQVAGIFLTIIETTRRVRAERALRENVERQRLAVAVGELATWDWDLRTQRVIWSDEHYRMEGYTVGEIQPSYEAWMARVHPDDRAGTEAALQRAMQGRCSYEHEFRTLHPDGSLHWLSARGHFFYDAYGQPVRMIGVMRDVTEQRRARELLEQRVAERTYALRQLLLHMETLQDDERRRIARELHDGLGQYLSSMALSVGSLRHAAVPPRDALDRLHDLMQQLDRELDRIIFILRPTALEDCGLAEGVAAYVQTWSELTGVDADVEARGLDGQRLPPQVEAAVFRVVQEALTNVAKYAHASRASVSLERRRRQLVGSVEDDGRGFSLDEAAQPVAGRAKWGLVGMQERIEALGGSFAIESQPGSGTTVLWRLPLGGEGEGG